MNTQIDTKEKEKKKIVWREGTKIKTAEGWLLKVDNGLMFFDGDIGLIILREDWLITMNDITPMQYTT